MRTRISRRPSCEIDPPGFPSSSLHILLLCRQFFKLCSNKYSLLFYSYFLFVFICISSSVQQLKRVRIAFPFYTIRYFPFVKKTTLFFNEFVSKEKKTKTNKFTRDALSVQVRTFLRQTEEKLVINNKMASSLQNSCVNLLHSFCVYEREGSEYYEPCDVVVLFGSE